MIDQPIEQIEVVIINFQAEIKASYALPLEKAPHTPEELVKRIAKAIRMRPLQRGQEPLFCRRYINPLLFNIKTTIVKGPYFRGSK